VINLGDREGGLLFEAGGCRRTIWYRINMIVSDSDRFVFVHVPKAAGWSMNEMLLKASPGSVHRYMHCRLCDLVARGLLEVEKYRAYFKFAIVRNPYDWLVSFYSFVRNRRHPYNRILATQTFDEFVRWIAEMRVHPSAGVRYQDGFYDMEFNPTLQYGQYWFISNEDGAELDVEMVLRFERLQNDVRVVMERIGLADGYAVPQLNKSRHDPYRNYYPNTETKDLVYALFRKDFDWFDYSADL
jgi:chondroitin 4-sulfotransferase 11